MKLTIIYSLEQQVNNEPVDPELHLIYIELLVALMEESQIISSTHLHLTDSVQQCSDYHSSLPGVGGDE